MTPLDLVELHINQNVLSKATNKKYYSVINTFIKDTNISNISNITNQQILNWRDKILSRSSAGNWNNYHRHMRALVQTAVNMKKLDDNPFALVKSIVHYPTNKQYTLSAKQINRLLVLCDSVIEHGWFFKTIVQMLSHTGIRRKQLVGLKWSDIDLENRVLRLRADSSKTKREYNIPLSLELAEELLVFINKTKFIVNYQKPDNQVFNITLFNARYKANNMNEEHIAKFFTKLSKIANFKVSAHRFRHSLATKLANNGKTSIKTVQNLLGHSSVHTTLGYVHPSMDNMRDALEVI